MPDKKERNGLSTPLKRFFGVGDFGFTLMSNIDTFYATYTGCLNLVGFDPARLS